MDENRAKKQKRGPTTIVPGMETGCEHDNPATASSVFPYLDMGNKNKKKKISVVQRGSG